MAWNFLNFDAPRYCPAMPRKLRLRLFLVILGHLAPLGTTGHGVEPHLGELLGFKDINQILVISYKYRPIFLDWLSNFGADLYDLFFIRIQLIYPP